MKGVGRRFTDITQKARGRTPLRYEFELIPYFVGELPSDVTKVLFAWERGTKVFLTDAEPVNANTHAAFWKQYLKQTVTMYATGNGSSVEPKDYAFKIQSIKEGAKGDGDRKTVGKIHVDLAQFCTGQADPAPTDIYLQLKPHGKLKISIKASFQKHAKFDDTMTELSGNPSDWASQTGGKGAMRHFNDDETDEQDLSGFDHQSDTASMSQYSTHRGGGSSIQATISEEGGVVEGEDDAAAERRARRAKRRKNKELTDPNRVRLPSEIEGGFELPMDPEELRRIQLEKKQERSERRKKDLEHTAMVAQITAQVKADMLSQEEASGGVICCCIPRKKKSPPADAEELSLLSANQAVEMGRSNKL